MSSKYRTLVALSHTVPVPALFALDDAQLAARDELAELLQRRADHLGEAQAVHQPEAHDGVGAAHQRPGPERVLLA